MFLIEPFIWMFSVKNFKHHFLYLLLTAAICWGISFAIIVLFGDYIAELSFALSIISVIALIALIAAPILCLTGYYWCLTDNIIDRDLEAKLNSIYNGKSTNLKNVITLPDWDIFRFIWRGIASSVASIIMYIPFTLLMILVVFNIGLVAAFWNLNEMQVIIIIGIFALLFSTLIPGLLWNYARRDSVVAVLNIPKAIYLMESYPVKYIFNSILIVVFSFARSYAMRAIIFALGLGAAITTTNVPQTYADLIDSAFLMVYIVLFIVGYIIDTYWIFVNAYLLGTIAPPSEY